MILSELMIQSWNLVHLASGKSYRTAECFDTAAVLLEHGHANPYVGQRELDIQWLGQDDWLAEGVFSYEPARDAQASRTWLRLDGLDTITEITLNGKPLGGTASAFTTHEFRVDEHLVAGHNKLLIKFIGPEKSAAREAARYRQPYPHSVYPIQSMHRNLIRKVQCHAGWDWGPSIMTSGIYAPPVLETADSARFRDFQVLTHVPAGEGAPWVVELTANADCWEACGRQLKAVIHGPDGREVATASADLQLVPGSSMVALMVEVRDPQLWWPNGMGDQPLYSLRVQVAGDRVESSGKILARTLGFRDLRLVSEEDEYGKSFFFKVNGIPFFAKGANWIPSDAVPSFQTSARTASLLRAVRDTNMNMIRVWGGGQYESDEFYELCNELGILVWQDMMFACGTYPAEEEFLSLVADETAFQVRRLSSHPSLALWCGNNETLGSLTWYEESRANPQKFLVDWDRLYEGTIGRIARKLDPTREYWPSSPSGGSGEFSDGWHQPGRGDMHYWSVWHEGKPFDDYFTVIPRFCSEFGFQSFPTAEGISRAMPEVADAGVESGSEFASYPEPGRRWAEAAEWNLTGPTVDFHQKSPRGNTIILETMARYYRMPSRLEDFFYLSQVQQHRAFETAVDWWRSCAPRTMGALYWQLNDLWPVASWSSIEYPDKWKYTQHGAGHFFEPLRGALLLRLPEREPGKAELSHAPVEALILNDIAVPCSVRVVLKVSDFAGGERVLADKVVALSGEMVHRLQLVDPEKLGIDGQEHFVSLRLYWRGFGVPGASAAQTDAGAAGVTAAGYKPSRGGVHFASLSDDDLVSSSTRFFTVPKRSALQDPGLELVWEGEGPIARVRIRARKPAFGVFLDSPGVVGHWSDNAFDIAAGEERVLEFVARQGGPGTWDSALRTARDEALIAEAEQAGIPALLRKYTRVYDLFSSAGTV